MSHPISEYRIAKFQQDRCLLPYNNIVIAERMRIDKSNYSKAVNFGPITHAFLEKFYAAFEGEIIEIKKKVMIEEEQGYGSRVINNLGKRCEVLEKGYNELGLKCGQITLKIASLDQKLDRVLGKVDKIETMLSLLAGNQSFYMGIYAN